MRCAVQNETARSDLRERTAASRATGSGWLTALDNRGPSRFHVWPPTGRLSQSGRTCNGHSCCRPRTTCAKQWRCTGRGHRHLFHVGFPHLPQRHPDSAPEGGVRAHLGAGDAGPVHLLRRVLPDVPARRAPGRGSGLQARHRCRPGHRRCRRAVVLAGSTGACVWPVPRRAVRAGHRHHRAAGRCQSLCCAARSGADQFQPADPGAVDERVGHHDRAVVRRPADSLGRAAHRR